EKSKPAPLNPKGAAPRPCQNWGHRAGETTQDAAQARVPELLLVAARAGGEGIAVGAGFGVAEEGAGAVGGVGADDVLELAGLGFGFRAVDGERVGEEALRKAVTADDIAGALRASGSELDVAV